MHQYLLKICYFESICQGVIKLENKLRIFNILFVICVIHSPFDQINILILIDPLKGELMHTFGMPFRPNEYLHLICLFIYALSI